MSRLQNFEALKGHPMLGNIYKKLSNTDLDLCREFLRETETLTREEYCMKVNRWYLDKPKPKRLSDMWALVLQSADRIKR
jgi:hypothetical protein